MDQPRAQEAAGMEDLGWAEVVLSSIAIPVAPSASSLAVSFSVAMIPPVPVVVCTFVFVFVVQHTPAEVVAVSMNGDLSVSRTGPLCEGARSVRPACLPGHSVGRGLSACG